MKSKAEQKIDELKMEAFKMINQLNESRNFVNKITSSHDFDVTKKSFWTRSIRKKTANGFSLANESESIPRKL